MNKIIRYSLRTLLYLGILLLLLWFALWCYISFNKADLINKITSRITSKTKAEASVKDLSVSLLQTFPFISLQLSDVILKDSLWKIHNKTFFTANNVYLRLSPFGLLSKDRAIGKIVVTGGNLHLYADSNNYNNQYIFRSEKPKENQNFSLPEIYLKNTNIIYENPLKNKLHHFNFTSFTVKNAIKNNLQVFDIATDMIVHSLAFNTQKGSYIKNKRLQGIFKVMLNRAEKNCFFQTLEF